MNLIEEKRLIVPVVENKATTIASVINMLVESADVPEHARVSFEHETKFGDENCVNVVFTWRWRKDG